MAFRNYILVCGGTACESSKANAIYEALVSECKAQGVADEVQIVKTGCFGFCEQGPIVKILPEDSFYVQVKPEDAKELVAEHIVKGREVKRLLYAKEGSRKHAKVEDIEFYQKQFRIVLRNCGFIDPENINEYIAREGYVALEKVLFEMTADDVIAELRTAGLRGRGGAGFPTWMKWNFTKQAESDQKYIVVNADEGDPGAYMDRSTLEGDPHSVLEAMAIAGKTVGANQGYIYIRAEYPLAIKRLEIAMAQAREYGLLGKDILGSGFDFDIEIRLGAGAFVCGEETALLASIEGKRGMPVPRPPFPAVKGLWGKPTVINNVETWANIPVIIIKGGDWFSRIGTADSHGTKVFALTGKIRNSGLVEVPMGTTLREIIYDIGGGIANDREFKAVQTGGPSGGVITKEFLDTPIDFGSLTKLGSMMGSGGMIVMDEDDCIVDVTKFYLNFTVDESCGKCSPCRIGGRSLANLLDKITKGKAELADLDQMVEIGEAMKKASLCALGQTAPNPILSTLHHFRDEYLAHVVDKRCPAGKCKSLISYHILPDKCIGCTACARKCPVAAISGERREVHVIDQAACIKCGVCYETCKFGAIEVR
ncbi:MAG: NADH-quinone oxidoreductase subunit J/K [Spirochaetae bacterium HGW-Spirochaetae-4]|nr:MAG: NADH dehydrogenase [Spirochaetes bacterium GWC2_52_13]OHD66784.1 MAG: NADH dehydrogenase [Spirochaetes bacterium GWF2_52_7]PKL22880.1 MAG: NADH-quinone oxidoreductase subunit J/K [Spirochaetae bacterium HGW-Spirochaetae-4]HCG65021.1 NADH-quinone oxidoreductase subunit J/K [Sphaerochaeta sp.]HCS36895.1 NADH-quinone oxidoreductase subunit J/K [Sphaerochaeta sp.]